MQPGEPRSRTSDLPITGQPALPPTLISKTNLVEAAMEDFFNFISFKGGGLEVSFVVIVEESEGLSRICGRDTLCGEGG